jgi:toxin HigB-1
MKIVLVPMAPVLKTVNSPCMDHVERSQRAQYHRPGAMSCPAGWSLSPPSLAELAGFMIDVHRQSGIRWMQMILSYRDKKTEAFASGAFVKSFQGFEDQGARRLSILNAAPDIATLRSLPSNRLEVLKGGRTGQYSIRINQQWRICFDWPDGQQGPSNFEIVDYH